MINFTFQKEVSDIPMILPVEMFIVEEETAAPEFQEEVNEIIPTLQEEVIEEVIEVEETPEITEPVVETLPEVRKNVQLIKGFFDVSLPEWLRQAELKQISLLHVDSDLYSSAKIVFDNLNDYIVEGTIIVFDEFYPWGRKRYETWAEHEYKAFCEWIETYHREFEILYRNNHQQCSIRVTK